jgi:hypothetical protein
LAARAAVLRAAGVLLDLAVVPALRGRGRFSVVAKWEQPLAVVRHERRETSIGPKFRP